MPFRRILLICFNLSLFAGQGLAQTDSVYSRMTLGSVEYKSQYMISPKYARPQATLLKRLKSAALAETAVRYCFSVQETKPTEAAIKSYATKCAAALKVTQVSGDTVSLAFGDPKISGIVPQRYLDNLMDAMKEDNLNFAIGKNQKSLDSLDKLLDKADMVYRQVRDTLYSFSNTAEFQTCAEQMIPDLADTVASMKRNLVSIGCDSFQVKRMFRQMDTLLDQFKRVYADTVSRYWVQMRKDASLYLFECEQLIARFQITVNTVVMIVSDTTLDPRYRERQKTTMIDILTEQLDQNLFWTLDHQASYTWDAPIKGKSFKTVLKRYQKHSVTYRKQLSARTETLVQRAGITPGGYIICRASKVKC